MFGATELKRSRHVRLPAVAGTFYPADRESLRTQIAELLGGSDDVGLTPKALIAPHAGYRYSGPIAASGYVLLKAVRQRIARVILLGPSHCVPFSGLATTTADDFFTPLGSIPIDREAVEHALKWSQVVGFDVAHQYEHSLEVQLPFLQSTLDKFSLVPFVVGEAEAAAVADVMEAVWGDGETLIVVSSDLSHYHDYQTARVIDSETSQLIQRCEWQQLSGERACGYRAICGLLKVAKNRGLNVTAVDLRNSGDTCGFKDEVVGYGSYVVS